MNQREIKFRAWIENAQEGCPKMFYQNDQYLQSFLKRCVFFSSDGREHEKYGNYKLSQYTGLKDKNGKEIYEGDRLENPEGKRGIVVFYDGCFRLQIFKGETSAHYITMNQGYCLNKIVIGNIYENPELLK